MRTALTLALLLATTGTACAESFDQMFPNHPGYENENVNEALRSMDYRQGEVVLPGGQAVVQVPEGYYFLDAEDSNTVLSYLWGNPEDPTTLGMIFPADRTPWDDVWGAEFSFEAMGYVSDVDADSIDYGALLAEMQSDAKLESEDRVAQGYDPVELIGWAEPPHYDATARKLHWAQELQFGENDGSRTLNYDLRALGREGVLSVNFIASMDQLAEVKAALPDVAGMISFAEGKRYADFDPSLDTVAAVGIAGLIAGKSMTAKGGLMVGALLLLKKFWFLLLLPFAWLGRLFRRG